MAQINNSGVINNTVDTVQSLSINNTGTINVTSAASPTPATYELASTLTGSSGAINISQHGTLQLDTAASGNNINFGDATGGLTIKSLSTYASTMKIFGLQAGDVIKIPNLPAGFKEAYNATTGVLTLSSSTNVVLGTLTFGGGSLPSQTIVQNAVVVCFASGTKIATPDGETPVDALKPGDEVMLHGGGTGAIEWVGKRDVDCKRHPTPRQVRPYRIAAHAFGDNQPAQDLVLSPDHAVLVDGVLIPVKYLANGRSVRQLTVPRVTYHHIELRDHAIILAEGLTVETLLPGSDKSSFPDDNGGIIQLHPNFSHRNWDAMGCAPLVIAGPELEQVRRALKRRASVLFPRKRRRAA